MELALTRLNVMQIVGIHGPQTHEELMKTFDCGYYAIDAILRGLCKEGIFRHDIIFTNKGYKNQHLFTLQKNMRK